MIVYADYVQSAKVRFDAVPDLEIDALIKEISAEASQSTRTYPVTFIMQPPAEANVKPGMAGEVTVSARLPEDDDRLGIQVPATAIFSGVDDETASYVWIIDEGASTLERREVTVLRLSDFGVIIGDGLGAGETIVTKGVNSLREGQKVEMLVSASEKQS